MRVGYALAGAVASKHSDVIVLATARNPSDAKDLKQLSERHPGKIEILQYVVDDLEQNRSLAKTIQEKYGYLDVVIANAATGTYLGAAEETPIEVFRDHLNINVVGLLALFQVTAPLLRKSKKTPKFIPLSSGAASLTAYIDMKAGYTCYGVSKVALNYVARRLHFENEWLTCFPLAPGIVDSDMSRSHREQDNTNTLAPIQQVMTLPPEKAAAMLLGIIDSSTREKEGGEFLNIDGSKIPW